MANMDFYNLQDSYKYIIEEGYFHVPEKVLKDIKAFYIENYKQYLKNGRGKVLQKLYPPKVFKLDFTGTRFEFLNIRNPSVKIYFTSSISHYSDYNQDKEDTLELFHQGNIHLELNINSFEGILSHTIEHEVMHYIQFLMHSLHFQTGAGYPNKKLWRKDVDAYGNRISGSGGTRVAHTQRPVEYYPDLLTAIRTLFYDYYNKIGNLNFSKKEEIKNKFIFFSNFLDQVNDTEYNSDVYNMTLAVDTFREFKKISTQFYKKIIKIAYNAFVNGERNFNPKEIESELKKIALNNTFDELQIE